MGNQYSYISKELQASYWSILVIWHREYIRIQIVLRKHILGFCTRPVLRLKLAS